MTQRATGRRRRSERALLSVVQQAYVEGVSTRRVELLASFKIGLAVPSTTSAETFVGAPTEAEMGLIHFLRRLIVLRRRIARRGYRPGQIWLVPRFLAEVTNVRTWSGFAYVAFIIDACSRYVIGWHACCCAPTSHSAHWSRRCGHERDPWLGSYITRTAACCDSRSATQSGWQRPEWRPRSAAGATRMTTPWRSR
jgi:transposase InsO family protein